MRFSCLIFTLSWLVVVCAIWLAPMFMVAGKLVALSWLPHRYRLQASCAALFTHHNMTWGKPLYAVRLAGGSGWMEVEGRLISPLEIAGYRTRPDRLAFEVSKKKLDGIWPRFAAHVALVMAREFPGIAPVEEVKIFKALVKHTQPEMMEPAGRWKVPPLFALPLKQRPELAHCRLEAGRWVTVKRESKGKPAVSPPKPGEVKVNPLPTRRLAQSGSGTPSPAVTASPRSPSPPVQPVTALESAPPGTRVRPQPAPATGAPVRPPIPQRTPPVVPRVPQRQSKGEGEP